MSELIVEVSEISKVEHPENCDKLDLVTVKGWNCLVGRGIHKVGDLVIYCPPDSVIPEKIIDEHNLEYLKNNGRVGTIKLRGWLSQGLILEIPKNTTGYKLGRDVAKMLGITKYEQPQASYQIQKQRASIGALVRRLIQRKITLHRFVFKAIAIIKDIFKVRKNKNPLFNIYTDINNIKHYNDLFTTKDDVNITEKIHGCLLAKTKISLANGAVKSIKEIVNSREQIKVLGVNNTGELVETKVINHFNNGRCDNWYNVKFIRKGTGFNKGNWFGSVKATNNHKFYNPRLRKYIKCEDLKPQDELLLQNSVIKLPYIAKQVLIGKMLGDGSRNANSMAFCHKKEHKQYLDYTLLCLGDIAGNCSKNQMSGYGTEMVRARSISNYSIGKLFESWFNKDNKKIVPINLRLSPISLAFWYMDDGSLTKNDKQEDRISLATCGFDDKSIENLINSLGKMGINAVKMDNRITINQNDAKIFFTLISPYVPKIMQYKLPKRFRGYNPIISESKIAKYQSVLHSVKIISVDKYNCGHEDMNRYDIKTETHNFFANGILVHNSNFRAGTLLIAKGKNILDNIAYWIKKNIKKQGYEFVYGSHKVQITGHRGRNCFYGEDVYGQIAERYKLAEIIPPGYVLYGEIYGAKIQKGYNYGLKDSIDVVFFDLKVNGEYVGYKEFSRFCSDRDLPMTPLLYYGTFNQERLNKLIGGASVLCPTQKIREGIVVKMMDEENHPRCGRKILKCINPNYLLIKDRTDYH